MGLSFLVQLAAGCLLACAACRTDHVAPSYLRRMGLIAVFVLVFVLGGIALTIEPMAVVRPFLGLPVWMAIALIIAWRGLVALQADAPKPSQRFLPLLAGLAAVLAARGPLVASAVLPPPLEVTAWASWIHVSLGAMLLGGMTAAMLLGHAYLTQTQMPIDPLRRLTRLLIAALATDAVWTGAMAAYQQAWIVAPRGDPLWLWLMLSVRVGVGLLGLGVLIYMVHDCVRRRSTQSATGILYIAMIFAFFGRLAAMELARSCRLWL